MTNNSKINLIVFYKLTSIYIFGKLGMGPGIKKIVSVKMGVLLFLIIAFLASLFLLAGVKL